MVDFQQTRKVQNGRFILVTFETAVNRELKLEQGRYACRKKRPPKLPIILTFLSKQSSQSKGTQLVFPSQTKPYKLMEKNCCHVRSQFNLGNQFFILMLPEKLIVPLIDNVKNHTHKIVVVLVLFSMSRSRDSTMCHFQRCKQSKIFCFGWCIESFHVDEYKGVFKVYQCACRIMAMGVH